MSKSAINSATDKHLRTGELWVTDERKGHKLRTKVNYLGLLSDHSALIEAGHNLLGNNGAAFASGTTL